MRSTLPLFAAGGIAGITLARNPAVRREVGRRLRHSADAIGLIAYLSAIDGRLPDRRVLRTLWEEPSAARLPLGWVAALERAAPPAVPLSTAQDTLAAAPAA